MGYKLINYTINVKYNAEATSAADAGLPSYYWSKILDAWANKLSSFNNITKGNCSGADVDNYYCQFNDNTLGMFYYKTQSTSNFPRFGTRTSSLTNFQLSPLSIQLAPITVNNMNKADFNKMKARFVIDDATNNVIYFSTINTNVHDSTTASDFDRGWGFLFANDRFVYQTQMFTLGASTTQTATIISGFNPSPQTEEYDDVFMSNVVYYDYTSKVLLGVVDHLVSISAMRIKGAPGEIVTVNGRKYMFVHDFAASSYINTTLWIPIDSIEEQSIDIAS